MMMKTSISRFDGVLVKSSHDWCDLGIGGQDKIVSVDEVVRVLSIWWSEFQTWLWTTDGDGSMVLLMEEGLVWRKLRLLGPLNRSSSIEGKIRLGLLLPEAVTTLELLMTGWMQCGVDRVDRLPNPNL